MPDNTEEISNNNNTLTNIQNNFPDVYDPYYIHPSDNPGQNIINGTFEGTNFGNWSRFMKNALIGKNKDMFIDGTLPKPPPNDPNCRKWIRCNAMVTSWLVNSLSRDITDSVLGNNSAKEIWDDLHERYGLTNGAQLYQVQKQLSDLTRGSDSISTYFTKFKKTWDELSGIWVMPVCTCTSTCGVAQKILKHEQDKRVVQFLMGLNEAYNNVRGTILMQNPLPSIGIVYSLLIQEEKQREISSHASINSEASAFLAQKKWNNQASGSNYKGNNQNRQQNYYSGKNTSPSTNHSGQGSGSGNYNGQNSGNSGNYANRQGSYNNANPGYKGKYVSPTEMAFRMANYYCNHCGVKGHTDSRCVDLKKKTGQFAGSVESQNGSKVGTGSNTSTTLVSGHISGQQQAQALSANQEYQHILNSFGNLQNGNSMAMSAGPINEEYGEAWAGM